MKQFIFLHYIWQKYFCQGYMYANLNPGKTRLAVSSGTFYSERCEAENSPL